MKPRFDAVLELALEQGVSRGLARAYKHANESPSDEVMADIHDRLVESIMATLHEWFDMEGS